MHGEIYQGNHCKRGHQGMRYNCDGSCVVCKQEKFAKEYENNPEKHKKSTREWKIVNPEKHREHSRVNGRKYKGLPSPTRPCPDLCEMPGCTQKATCLDHDHKTGLFRGWLCSRHNRALGLFEDCIEGLERALEYLRRNTKLRIEGLTNVRSTS